MQEVFSKIIEKLEELHERYVNQYGVVGGNSRAFAVRECIDIVEKIVKQEVEKFGTDTNVGGNGWISVGEELPKDGDNRYYMCIVENHEEDPPMYCQYDEECGFGFYKDIYDEHTLGFVDCEFNTNEELGYEKVIAWQQLLPYQPKGD